MRHNEKLKVIGLIIMVIDHFYLFLFGVNPLLYCIARFIGFPFFAYGVAMGAQYTRDKNKYLRRLVLFGLAVQPLFFWATDLQRLNICFTLALGALAVMLWRDGRFWMQAIALAIPFIGGPWSDPFVGYGGYGIGLILSFGMGPAFAVAYQAFSSAWFLGINEPQALAVLSLLFVYWIPVPSVQLPKWVYYASYPGHLAIIAAARLLV